MPQCGCFHEYELTPVSDNEHRLRIPSGGYANLPAIIEKSGLALSVSETKGTDFYSLLGTTFVLRGVREYETLCRFLDHLKHRVIVDLTPWIDQCYSLGPYSLFQDESRVISFWGDQVNRAKYRRESRSTDRLNLLIDDFIEHHLALRTLNSVLSAPKSDVSTPDLAGSWVANIVDSRGWARVTAVKTRSTGRPQKARQDNELEEDLLNRIAGSISVTGVEQGSRVLVVDDIIGSGGTIKEIGRALRESGASEVYALSVAKDAKFTRGVGLAKELWE